MSEEIDIKEMVNDLFDEVKDTSLVNEIKYLDWEEHKKEYPKILKSLVDVGIEHIDSAYMENVPGWVYTLIFTNLFGITTENASGITRDNANYMEVHFTSPLMPNPTKIKITKEDTETYEIIDENTNEPIMGIIASFYEDKNDENLLHLNLTMSWNKEDTMWSRRLIGFVISYGLFHLTTFVSA